MICPFHKLMQRPQFSLGSGLNLDRDEKLKIWIDQVNFRSSICCLSYPEMQTPTCFRNLGLKLLLCMKEHADRVRVIMRSNNLMLY